jgi:hypothetical protein
MATKEKLNLEKLNLETLTTVDECLAAIGQYPAQAVEISAKLAELAEAKGRAEAKAKQPRVAKVKAERTISDWLTGNPGEALGVISNEVARQLSIPATDTIGYTSIVAAIGFQFGAVMTAGGGNRQKTAFARQLEALTGQTLGVLVDASPAKKYETEVLAVLPEITEKVSFFRSVYASKDAAENPYRVAAVEGEDKDAANARVLEVLKTDFETWKSDPAPAAVAEVTAETAVPEAPAEVAPESEEITL